MKKNSGYCMLTVLLVFASCAWFRPAQRGEVQARAEMRGFLPSTIQGTVFFEQVPGQGLRIHGEIAGLLPDSSYGVHIHQYGNCSNPSAPGMHFDPGNSNTHGEPWLSPGEHHAGDLPNIKAGGDGKAQIDFMTKALGVGQGRFSVIGRSLVINAHPDDFTTQPDGNSGPSIACGVIRRVTR